MNADIRMPPRWRRGDGHHICGPMAGSVAERFGGANCVTGRRITAANHIIAGEPVGWVCGTIGCTKRRASGDLYHVDQWCVCCHRPDRGGISPCMCVCDVWRHHKNVPFLRVTMFWSTARVCSTVRNGSGGTLAHYVTAIVLATARTASFDTTHTHTAPIQHTNTYETKTHSIRGCCVRSIGPPLSDLPARLHLCADWLAGLARVEHTHTNTLGHTHAFALGVCCVSPHSVAEDCNGRIICFRKNIRLFGND